MSPSGSISDRDAARRRLVEAVRGGARAVILSGPAGAGKTWLAEAALGDLATAGHLIGTGKYAEGETRSAFEPIIAALAGMVRLLLARFYDEQAGIASLSGALGTDLEVLLSAGLQLPGIAASGALRAPADRRRGATRIGLAAASLLRWADGFGIPLALLLDDWRRAPAEAIDLIQRLALSELRTPLALVLAQREPASGDELGGVAIETIALGPLDDDAVAILLAERLGDAVAAHLAVAALHDSLPRLPFDVLQAADVLLASGALARESDGWRFNRAAIEHITFDAPARIRRLSPEERALARALALWGDSAPVAALLAGAAAAPATLDRLIASRVLESSAGRAFFRHDRLLRAALDSLSFEDRSRTAAAMAERLIDGDWGEEVETAALHLRLEAGIAAVDPARWRDRLARGARRARSRGDAAGAIAFAEAALALRAGTAIAERDADRLILQEALLAAANRGHPATLERAEALVASARSPAERCDDFETGANALRFAGQPDAAWAFARRGLREAGIRIPERGIGVALATAALRWWWSRRPRWNMRGTSAAPLEGFTAIAATAAEIAYHRDPRLTALIGFKASFLASRHSLLSPYWQSVDSFLFAILGDPRRAAHAGECAIAAFAEQREYRASTLYQATFFGTLWHHRLADERPRFREVKRIALAEGDLAIAAYALRNHVMSGWRTTGSLDELLREATAAWHELRALGEPSFVEEMASMVALLQAMTGRASWTIDAWRTDIATRNHPIDLELTNMIGDWEASLRRTRALTTVLRDYALQSETVTLRFHMMLARLKTGRRIGRGELARLRRAAALNPADHAAKLALIEAELLRVRGRPSGTAYSRAVARAEAGDSRLLAGIAAQCAAQGDPANAAAWQARARAIWQDWGARCMSGASDAVPASPLEDALARADAAERASHARARLMAHAGHELRTPLQALQGLLDLAADGEPLDVASVRAVLGSLTSVVDDVSLLSTESDAAGGDVATAVDLEALVRSEIALWRGRRAIALVVPAPLPLVDVAAARVRQVVRNLLSNAVKYGGPAITVRVTLAAGTDTDQVATIRVDDDGAGLPLAMLERVFEPFERGEHEGDGRGQGLGLALARRIAGRLGGSLTAANRSSGGARFELRLPCAIAGPAPARAPCAASILLVEDVALIRTVIATILTRAGHHVVEAERADQALAAWRGGGFDLAILDLGLPDASGLTVAEAIRARDPMTPVILLTAAIDGSAEEAARADPRLRLVRKPASAERLLGAIAALLDTHAPPTPADDAFAPLYAAAQAEVASQARRWLASPPTGRDQPALHKLAGLAVQFGFAEVAAAVEAMEGAVTARHSLAEPTRDLARALERIDR